MSRSLLVSFFSRMLVGVHRLVAFRSASDSFLMAPVCKYAPIVSIVPGRVFLSFVFWLGCEGHVCPHSLLDGPEEYVVRPQFLPMRQMLSGSFPDGRRGLSFIFGQCPDQAW